MRTRELRIQLDQYLSARSALGFKDRGRKTLLQGFVRYLVKMKYDGAITSRLAVDWATTTPKARATGLAGPPRRLSAARGFLSHVRASSDDVEIPAAGLLAAIKGRRPYLYTAEQIGNLLQAALALGPEGTLRPHTYQTLLGLMASTGIRVGEAIRLKSSDVELDATPALLQVRDSKFGKSRVVPLHPTATEHLKQYAEHRRRLGYGKRTDAFFVSERGGHVYYGCLVQWFIRTTRRLGMYPPADRRTPTLHGLRHYFAIERLTLWCRQGVCIHDLAPQLSVYLGHVKPEQSYWYFTATPELLRAAGESFQSFANTGVPS
jgi:integrase/recombinase XerD